MVAINHGLDEISDLVKAKRAGANLDIEIMTLIADHGRDWLSTHEDYYNQFLKRYKVSVSASGKNPWLAVCRLVVAFTDFKTTGKMSPDSEHHTLDSLAPVLCYFQDHNIAPADIASYVATYVDHEGLASGITGIRKRFTKDGRYHLLSKQRWVGPSGVFGLPPQSSEAIFKLIATIKEQQDPHKGWGTKQDRLMAGAMDSTCKRIQKIKAESTV